MLMKALDNPSNSRDRCRRDRPRLRLI